MSKSLSAFMRPNVAEIKNASFAPSLILKSIDLKDLRDVVIKLTTDEHSAYQVLRLGHAPNQKRQLCPLPPLCGGGRQAGGVGNPLHLRR